MRAIGAVETAYIDTIPYIDEDRSTVMWRAELIVNEKMSDGTLHRAVLDLVRGNFEYVFVTKSDWNEPAEFASDANCIETASVAVKNYAAVRRAMLDSIVKRISVPAEQFNTSNLTSPL